MITSECPEMLKSGIIRRVFTAQSRHECCNVLRNKEEDPPDLHFACIGSKKAGSHSADFLIIFLKPVLLFLPLCTAENPIFPGMIRISAAPFYSLRNQHLDAESIVPCIDTDLTAVFLHNHPNTLDSVPMINGILFAGL